jgi:hypothetical protein
MPSEPGTPGPVRHDVSESAVRAQLERILASPVFSRSQQLRRFLTFIVDQTLSGQGPTIKEAVLAHEVYGKGPDFDGGTDPVVRVDARRLRDKLREYYERRSDPIVISLPKGSYIPVFEGNSTSAAETAGPIAPEAPREKREFPDSRRVSMSVAALVVAVAVVTALIAWRSRGGPRESPAQLLPLASYPGIEGAAGAVAGRQPCRLRMVWRRRPWPH